MATCFLFAQHFNDESCLSLRLNEQGQLDAPLERRTVDALKALQVKARTMVVLPTESSSLHQVELPWLAERKAREALPYALEEQVAQQLTSVHVAFDKPHYKNNQYLAVVIDKAYLLDLMTRLDALALDFDVITLDWFALHSEEVCVSDTSLLIHDNAFKGALSPSLAPMYVSELPILMFSDSALELKNEACTPVDGSFYKWTAQRLLAGMPMNLCQGDLQHNTRQDKTIRWYQAAAALAGIWLASFLVLHAVMLHQLTNKLTELDEQIAVVYHEFFPDARQVISPRFRVGQLLKSGSGQHSEAIWPLLDKLALGVGRGEYGFEQWRYQNQSLAVTLLAKDFAALEVLQRGLQQAGVKVKQNQASSHPDASHEQQVIATLELTL